MRGVDLVSHPLNAHNVAHAGSQENGRMPNFSLKTTRIIVEEHNVQFCLPDTPDLICKREGLHTLEAGRETGSKAKWLIRRSCRCVPWRVLDISFSFCSSPPDMACDVGGAVSRFAGSISSLTDAKRTAGEASAFLGSGLTAGSCSGAVKEVSSERTAYCFRPKCRTWRN